MNTPSIYWLCFFLLIGKVLVPGAVQRGFKPVTNYNVKDYRLHVQNWCITADSRGLIYVGNNSGLLEYDGVRWRVIAVPGKLVRSMCRGGDGAVYLGGNGQIGRIIPDRTGTPRYQSLTGGGDTQFKNLGNVWSTVNTPDGVYFSSYRLLLRYDPRTGKRNTWTPAPGGKFLLAFFIRGTLYVGQRGTGLMQIKNGRLELVPGGGRFAFKSVYMMVPQTHNTILIGARNKGFFVYDNKTIRELPAVSDSFLEQNKLFRGAAISSNGHIALATRHGGLLIADALGNPVTLYDKHSGLDDNGVNYIYPDGNGNLWLALETGISKIEYASPVSVYPENLSGLSGRVFSVTRTPGGVLYAGTSSGLFVRVEDRERQFQRLMKHKCWDLSPGDGYVLAATNEGIYRVEQNHIREVSRGPVYCLVQSRSGPRRLWAGSRNFFMLLRHGTGGDWETVQRFRVNAGEIRSIAEGPGGGLWLGTMKGKAINAVVEDRDNGSRPIIKTFGKNHGLPPGEINVFYIHDRLYFVSTEQGIFYYDPGDRRFKPDLRFGQEFTGPGRGVYRLAAGAGKNVWIHSRSRTCRAVFQPDGTYGVEKNPLRRLPVAQVNRIYPEPGKDWVWFATNDGLFRYDNRPDNRPGKNYGGSFPTLIRMVKNGDRVLYGGSPVPGEPAPGGPVPVLSHDLRNLSITYAAVFYQDSSRTRYSHFLEGADSGWSRWESAPFKEYAYLDAGEYRFRVRARNVYHQVSGEAVFSFKVLPPWYRKWWAYLIYGLIIGFAMFLVVRWRSGKLEREKRKLEHIVHQRTQEIEEQKKQLEQHAVQLEEQSGKLKELDKVKSRFFANISHEFRTPLTLIMGPLEQMLARDPGKEEKKQYSLMLRNSQRLLSLINQLLDLSRFESGQVKLRAARQDIAGFLKGVAASFESVAQRNELTLEARSGDSGIFVYFDGEKIEEVIFNLLSNAVKFTPPGGCVTISTRESSPNETGEHFPAGFVEVSVSDTGPGIPRDQLGHIFDRFYQSDVTSEHHGKGSGIGLAIAKELVELHHGSIDIHSRAGKGTEFIIRLPMGNAHLEPGDIVEETGLEPVNDNNGEHIKDITAVLDQKYPGKFTVDEESAGKSKEEPKEETKEETKAEPLEPWKNIILVVEDSADVRDYIREALSPAYHVIDARDGEEGVKLAREKIPDLIISDIMMPGMDGCALCRELKNDIVTSHIPIILLTAKTSEEDIVTGLETGADDYVTKPFSTKVLCARIKNLIDLRTHRQETLGREMSLKPAKIELSAADKRFIKDFKAVIDANISDPEFNVDQLCRELDMSQPTVYRKIHALSGESPTDFIRSYRLKRGAELLKENFGSVIEVALEVGFSSSSYFTRCFKKKFHQLPSTYRASQSV